MAHQSDFITTGTSSADYEPATKRRKVRKGTTSCWECKRRKERCIFLHKDKTCVSCQKRSTACVSQEISNVSLPRTLDSNGNLHRIETLLQQVLERLDGAENNDQRNSLNDIVSTSRSGEQFGKAESAYHTPGACTNQSHPLLPQHQISPFTPTKDLSRILYDALPSRHDAEVICKATIRHQMYDIMICAYDETEPDSHALAQELLSYPEPTSTPAVLAKHLLRFATHLQKSFRPELHEEIKELSAPLPVLINSYANAASHVISQDRLLGGIDSLECLTLFAIYQCTSGSLRNSWMTMRRTVALAQMNGLHLPEKRRHCPPPDSKSTLPGPRRLWYRLNFYDRMSSLLLALPMAVQDSSISAAVYIPDERPLAKVERMHCVILGDIVKRNQADMSARNLETTRAFDLRLEKTAEILPAAWWNIPLLQSDRLTASGFRNDMRRITLQLIHAHLILQVHLPYLLQSTPESGHDLSRIACVDAAREILTRFILCRSLHHDDMVCRVTDFLAFTAAVALAIAYLSRHHQCLKTSTWPLHHRHGDLGMIQQTEEIMRVDNPVGYDEQCAHMADILHQLLCMEARAADGSRITIRHVKSTSAAGEKDQAEGVCSLQVPYFGTIMIDPEVPSAQEVSAGSAEVSPRYTTNAYGPVYNSEAPTNCASLQSTKAAGKTDPLAGGLTSTDPAMLTPAESLNSFDAMPTFAGADDWALQGIDTTLFSSLFGQTAGDWVLNG